MKRAAADLSARPSSVIVGRDLALDPEAAPLLEKLYGLLGVDPWTEIPMLALWIHRAVALTAAGPGGAKLVVVDEKNGLHRDSAHWLQTPRAELRAALKDLVDALEGGGSGGLVGAPTHFVNGRGAQLVFGDAATIDAKKKDGVWYRAAYGDIDTLVLVGDVLKTLGLSDLGKARTIWFQHSLPQDFERAGIPGFVDVVFPLAHPYEQAGSFVSLEGRAQGFDAGGVPPGESKADWQALVAFARELGTELPTELTALRKRLAVTTPDAFSSLGPNRARARAELSIV